MVQAKKAVNWNMYWNLHEADERVYDNKIERSVSSRGFGKDYPKIYRCHPCVSGERDSECSHKSRKRVYINNHAGCRYYIHSVGYKDMVEYVTDRKEMRFPNQEDPACFQFRRFGKQHNPHRLDGKS